MIQQMYINNEIFGNNEIVLDGTNIKTNTTFSILARSVLHHHEEVWSRPCFTSNFMISLLRLV